MITSTLKIVTYVTQGLVPGLAGMVEIGLFAFWANAALALFRLRRKAGVRQPPGGCTGVGMGARVAPQQSPILPADASKTGLGSA